MNIVRVLKRDAGEDRYRAGDGLDEHRSIFSSRQ
jgi:hypothetical protein